MSKKMTANCLDHGSFRVSDVFSDHLLLYFIGRCRNVTIMDIHVILCDCRRNHGAPSAYMPEQGMAGRSGTMTR